MAMMLGVVGALSAFYADSANVNDPIEREISARRMIAKVPTLAAMAYKYSIGQPFVYPDNSLGFAENFLHMMFSTPCEPYEVNPVLAKAMDKIFTLHADHDFANRRGRTLHFIRLLGNQVQFLQPFFDGFCGDDLVARRFLLGHLAGVAGVFIA